MNISNSQVNRLRHFVRAGLRSLFRPEPQTAVEWADANYYLPKESAYQEGRWETLPFQRAIMNAMGSDYIREVNVVKSARVGYSKMLLGVYAYFIEHKQRNTLIWLPTDGDAENFMKTHVEPSVVFTKVLRFPVSPFVFIQSLTICTQVVNGLYAVQM